MPQFQQGDMWSAYNRANLFLVTTNSTLKRNNALVMGRGIARQARDRFPGIGNGGLSREAVLPLLAALPHQVTIWEYAPPGSEAGR
jgi:hypothetical protein